MSSYFPSGLKLDDTQSPIEILQEAQRDWEAQSGGLLTLILQTAKSKSDNDLILVHVKHIPSSRTVSLFSVVYRPGNPYPATIQPREDELPKFLRKSYYEPGFDAGFLLSAATKVQGKTVTNQWVSETPSEFRRNLTDAFNLGIVKSEVLNLVCKTPEVDTEESAIESKKMEMDSQQDQ
jgi:hypothetical protein